MSSNFKKKMKYCSNCGAELNTSSKYCGQCGHQSESLNKEAEVSEHTEKPPVKVYKKTKKTNLPATNKIIRYSIFSICGLFILTVAFFGINGWDIPTVGEIYKQEKFKKDFFGKPLKVNSIESLSISYNGKNLEYWERNDRLSVFPLPTRNLVRNLENLSKIKIVISDESCVKIDFPKIFGRSSENVLSQICYTEKSSYIDSRMLFESPESLNLEGFGPVKLTLFLFHVGERNGEFHGELTIGYDIVDTYWLGVDPKNPKETAYSEITVGIRLTNK